MSVSFIMKLSIMKICVSILEVLYVKTIQYNDLLNDGQLIRA